MRKVLPLARCLGLKLITISRWLPVHDALFFLDGPADLPRRSNRSAGRALSATGPALKAAMPLSLRLPNSVLVEGLGRRFADSAP